MVHIANIKKNYFLAHGKKIQYFNISSFTPKFPEAIHVNIINFYNVYSSSPLIHILLKYFCGKKDCIDHIAHNRGKVGEGED